MSMTITLTETDVARQVATRRLSLARIVGAMAREIEMDGGYGAVARQARGLAARDAGALWAFDHGRKLQVLTLLEAFSAQARHCADSFCAVSPDDAARPDIAPPPPDALAVGRGLADGSLPLAGVLAELAAAGDWRRLGADLAAGLPSGGPDAAAAGQVRDLLCVLLACLDAPRPPRRAPRHPATETETRSQA